MDKQIATDIRGHALRAISELSQLLNAALDRCSAEEYEQIRRGVGLSIGRIQTDVLDFVCSAYPELDDLR